MEIVPGLFEMGFTFPIAALLVLCFVVVTQKVLLTHQCPDYCWATRSYSISAVSAVFPTHQQTGHGQILGGDIARMADPNQPKGSFMPHDVCSAMKARRKEEDIAYLQHLSSEGTTTHTEAIYCRK